MKEKVSKIAVHVEADQCLDRMLLKVNEGFTGGRVSKSDLASWILRSFESQVDGSLEKIRKEHFDEVAYLENALKEMKQARKDGKEVMPLSAVLAPMTAVGKAVAKKKEQVVSNSQT